MSSYHETSGNQALNGLSARRAPFKARSAYFAACCFQRVWLLLAVTPIIILICAIEG